MEHEYEISGGKLVDSHVVFALKNSRYEFERIKRIKPVGYIAPTYPFIEGPEEEILIEVLCNVAIELKVKIIAKNFCGDHVHCIIRSEKEDISRLMMLWKGKTSYVYNRRVYPSESRKITGTDGFTRRSVHF